MSEYYAVIRSTDHLAHYGVKGMKWGVRKAIEKGNAKSLSRHYKMAQKKLKKLNIQADTEIQNDIANKYKKSAKASAKAGAALLGVTIGIRAGQDVNNALARKHELNQAKYTEKYDQAFNGNLPYSTANAMYRAAKISEEAARIAKSRSQAFTNVGRDLGPALLGTSIGGFGYAAYSGVKSGIARKRTTKQGHAKAVAKRDAWEKEMRSAFKGTQYDASKGSIKKRRV